MRYCLLAGILFYLLFHFYPELDLSVSALFWTPEQHFHYRDHWFTHTIYHGLRGIAYTVSITLLLLLAYRALRSRLPLRTPPFPHLTYRPLLFLLLALILGPGLIIHQGFKEYFERARPVNIEQFGGNKRYTAPFEVSDQQGKSFISGHAGMAFYLTAFGLVFRRNRPLWYGTGLALGTLAGLGRIMQGGHFLSDVLFAAVVVLWLNHFLYWLLFRKRNSTRM